jgi:KAP family P-loop domain.
MNKNIINFLNEYVEIPNPQYAIMLRGAWGCGKTFFIHQWMKQLNNKGADKLEWQPIYVSLYGLTNIQQITEQINKEISPWLYSKGMKFAKNILKVASKIALKYELDMDGNGKNEGSVTYNLDSILLLKEDNIEIKGNKILIFDDLERCDVKLETLLGYINYFSEHCKCKVIIIGDEDRITAKENKDSNLKFKDFKEKTIGRTFEITVNVEETLDFFINEISTNNRNLLSENKELIIKIFHASKFNNLRVLRQCLNDYHRIVMALPEHYHKSSKYKLIITSLLANFVAVYCEYKSGNTQIGSLFNSLSRMFTDKEKNEEREKIMSKYRFIEIGKKLDIFSDFLVNEIVCYLESGYFDTTYLRQYFAAENASLESWEYLYDYWRLNNEEYEKYYNETVRYYLEDKSTDLKELFVIISILSVLYNDNLVFVPQKDIIAQGKHSIDRLMEGIYDIDDLLNCKSKVHSGTRRHNNGGSNKILSDLIVYFEKLFEQRFEKCPNKVSVMLENLTDETCERLSLALNDVLPVRQILYRDTSIFQEADVDKVSNSILGLSNESRNTFLHFLLFRYKFTSSGNEIECLSKCCQSDLPQLKLINRKLKIEAANKRLIEKYSIEKITNLIDEITAKTE